MLNFFHAKYLLKYSFLIMQQFNFIIFVFFKIVLQNDGENQISCFLAVCLTPVRLVHPASSSKTVVLLSFRQSFSLSHFRLLLTHAEGAREKKNKDMTVFRTSCNRDVSYRPLARSLAPLTHSLAPRYSLHCAHSFARLLTSP